MKTGPNNMTTDFASQPKLKDLPELLRQVRSTSSIVERNYGSLENLQHYLTAVEQRLIMLETLSNSP
jgi:hypothetical protein